MSYIDPEKENYTRGDLVYKTARDASAYPRWKVSRGIVIVSKRIIVWDESMGASDRAMFHQRYGKRETYPIFDIVINTPEGDFCVSQFGFNKDPDQENKP